MDGTFLYNSCAGNPVADIFSFASEKVGSKVVKIARLFGIVIILFNSIFPKYGRYEKEYSIGSKNTGKHWVSGSRYSAKPRGYGSALCRNKVNYNQFHFIVVVRTHHFSIYTYLEDTSRQNEFAQMAEEWYTRHQVMFRDTFQDPNPVILYNAHGHFRQTQAIPGLIDVGTGGVTEGLKNRVVIPWMES